MVSLSKGSPLFYTTSHGFCTILLSGLYTIFTPYITYMNHWQCNTLLHACACARMWLCGCREWVGGGTCLIVWVRLGPLVFPGSLNTCPHCKCLQLCPTCPELRVAPPPPPPP